MSNMIKKTLDKHKHTYQIQTVTYKTLYWNI